MENHADLDYVPLNLFSPPDSRVAPPVVTHAQTLPLHGLSSENFERLCLLLARASGEVERCRLYGTPGQKQHGIDLFAKPSHSEKYRVYQCKRYEQFDASDVAEAVQEFRTGKWFGSCSDFLICTSATSARTQLADECERQRGALGEAGINFEILDCEEISRQLKDKPTIVDDFFGRAWVNEFCGSTSVADELRLDGLAVTAFREQMRRFYEALVEQLDPGIPIPPAAGREVIPLRERFVVPEVQVETGIVEVQRNQQASTQTTAATQQPAQEKRQAVQEGRGQRKYTQRLPAHSWIAQGKNCILVGGPGSGKSTLLRYLALEILSDNPSNQGLASCLSYLPVWIPFAFWTQQISDNRECNIPECIQRWLHLWAQSALWPRTQDAINDSRLLLLIDGLDEWSTIEAGEVAANLLQVFLQTHHAKAIATTRPFTAVTLHGPEWQIAEIAPLTVAQQSELARKWFSFNARSAGSQHSIGRAVANRQASDFMVEVSKSRDLEELAQVPLLFLSLIFVHLRRAALPTDRFAAYNQLVTYLIQEHPAKRRAAALSAHDFGFAPLREPDVRHIFSYIAYATNPATVVGSATILQLVERVLNDSTGLDLDLPAIEARQLADQFARVAEGGCGLIIKQGFDDRSFLHRTLQEFLASAYLARLPLEKQQEFVREHSLDQRWREIILGLIWHTDRPNEVKSLLTPLLVPSNLPTDEMYRVELIAEIAFGPFNCPTADAKEFAADIFRRIQRHEWLPHRLRLMSHALQGSTSAKTRTLIRNRLTRWVYERSGWRSSWVSALKDWPLTAETADLLFDLLNDHQFEVQKTAARTLVTTASAEIINLLRADFRRTLDPFRQAAIFHGLNSVSQLDDLDAEIDFARSSRFGRLCVEGIRARVNRSVADREDLRILLSMADRQNRSYSLSDDISDLLTRGWSNEPQLKKACFDGLHHLGPGGGLDPDIATRVLLSAFPGDADVAKYGADEFRTQRYPFTHFHHFAYQLLAANFRDNRELVAAIDAWGPSQEHNQPEVAYAALVGRTPTMKQTLIKNLQSWIPFWAAESLIEGWGAKDQEVADELLKVAFGPAAGASGVAEQIPIIVSDRERAYERLRELLLDPDTKWHGRVLDALVNLGLSPAEREDTARISMELVSRVPHLRASDMGSTIISSFKDLDVVRGFAMRALQDRQPPVAAVASAYGADANVRSAITTLISPLPQPLRSAIIGHLSKGDEDQFALNVLADYDKENDSEVKTEASVAYHKLLLPDGPGLLSATATLSDSIIAYGMDMEARRQAALAALIVLKRVDIMLLKRESIGDNRMVSIRPSHDGELNLALARTVAENWVYVSGVLKEQLTQRFGGAEDPIGIWRALAIVGVDIPIVQAAVFDRLDTDATFSLTPEALSFVARLRPRSELLKRRCISAIKGPGGKSSDMDTVTRAIAILGEQFQNDGAIAAEIADGERQFSPILLALAALNPDHPWLGETYKAIMAGGSVTMPVYFATLYARIKSQDIVRELQRDLDRTGAINRYNCDDVSTPIIRRLKRDADARATVTDTLLGSGSPGTKMNLFRLMDAAGLITPLIREKCLGEANEQVIRGMVESAFDLVTGTGRSIPLCLLDVADRAE
jgi:energy-coupling factor transporter ATP-binding protein EcfA2